MGADLAASAAVGTRHRCPPLWRRASAMIREPPYPATARPHDRIGLLREGRRAEERGVRLLNQVGAMRLRPITRLIRAPGCDLGVMTAQEDLGNAQIPPHRGLRVHRALEELFHRPRSE